MPSVEQLLELLKSEPEDTFLRYGLAMEYAKLGRHDESLAEFDALLKHDPNYVAAYFMAGRTCEQKGDIEQAKSRYRVGIETARRVGDRHAEGEISQALFAIE